jgi:hypothetical protein
MSARLALPLALLAAVAGWSWPAAARRRSPQPAASSKTVGLGRSCRKNADCKSRSQRCLHENDANGKRVSLGFCVLPCASFEAGTTKVVPGEAEPPAAAAPVPAPQQTKKKLRPRCPPKFACRSKGSGVPIDMCVKG